MVVEWSGRKVEWSSGVVEWSSVVVEWSSVVVELFSCLLIVTLPIGSKSSESSESSEDTYTFGVFFCFNLVTGFINLEVYVRDV